MAYVGTYRTKSGRHYFRWSFEEQSNGEVRAYIVDQPSYRGRAADGHSTHRYTAFGGRKYVCYDPMPTNREDAIKIAKAWAENTERYIEIGQRF